MLFLGLECLTFTLQLSHVLKFCYSNNGMSSMQRRVNHVKAYVICK